MFCVFAPIVLLQVSSNLSCFSRWWWSTQQAVQADSDSKRAVAKAPASSATGTAGKAKRPSRSRKAAAVTAATTKITGHSMLPAASSSSSALLRDEPADGHDDNAEMRARLTAMQARYGAELHFLVTEFSKMEAQLSTEVTVSAPCPLVAG